MNCSHVAEKIPALARGLLSGADRATCLDHIDACDDCGDALRGAEAMQLLRRRQCQEAPEGLFARVLDAVSLTAGPGSARRFWLGAAAGSGIAASLFAAVVMMGLLVRPVEAPHQEFRVSVHEARTINIAFEASQALPGAQINILLSGDVEIDGTGGRRELSWVDDLEAGVNKLSLPILASGDTGGQMVVQLRHPDSEQMVVIDLPVEG